jgi:hypothetical protein
MAYALKVSVSKAQKIKIAAISSSRNLKNILKRKLLVKLIAILIVNKNKGGGLIAGRCAVEAKKFGVHY